MKKKAASKKHYLKLVEWSEEDGVYVGRCPELFLGGVHGADELKVYRELCQVVDEVLAMKVAHEDPLPEPLDEKEFSGKFVLRLDPNLHKQLALRALAEGQSLNAYCAHRLGGMAGLVRESPRRGVVHSSAGRRRTAKRHKAPASTK